MVGVEEVRYHEVEDSNIHRAGGIDSSRSNVGRTNYEMREVGPRIFERNYRFTQAGIFLAFNFPGFFLSTRRGSRVMQPAKNHH